MLNWCIGQTTIEYYGNQYAAEVAKSKGEVGAVGPILRGLLFCVRAHYYYDCSSLSSMRYVNVAWP